MSEHESHPPGSETPVEERAEIERLLASGALSVVFQPIVDLRSRKMIGVEALARLVRPAGAVPPARFIPIAARAGLLDLVLDQVLRAVADRIGHLDDRTYVAVNFSSLQLGDPRFAPRLQQTLANLGIRPDRLVLETSEADLQEFDHNTEHQLRSLRDAGIRISADDVGTGYSNLSTLIALRPDIVKIDRSLVLGLPEAPWDAVVAALVELADSIGASVVAEGIETNTQLAAVQDLGVHAAQGFLLGRPADIAMLGADPIWLEPARREGRAPRVGLIDDDPRLLALVADVLHDDGFDVVLQECDSATFLSRLRHTPVDIAVVDLVLGDGEDGMVSIVRPVRHLRPEIEIIVFSSLFDPLCRVEAEGLGCKWIEKADGPDRLSGTCVTVVEASARPLVLPRSRAHTAVTGR